MWYSYHFCLVWLLHWIDTVTTTFDSHGNIPLMDYVVTFYFPHYAVINHVKVNTVASRSELHKNLYDYQHFIAISR